MSEKANSPLLSFQHGHARTFKAAFRLEPVGLSSPLLAACKLKSTRPPTVAEGANADTEVAHKATNAKESFILDVSSLLLILLPELIQQRPNTLSKVVNGIGVLPLVDRHGLQDTSKRRTKCVRACQQFSKKMTGVALTRGGSWTTTTRDMVVPYTHGSYHREVRKRFRVSSFVATGTKGS